MHSIGFLPEGPYSQAAPRASLFSLTQWALHVLASHGLLLFCKISPHFMSPFAVEIVVSPVIIIIKI